MEILPKYFIFIIFLNNLLLADADKTITINCSENQASIISGPGQATNPTPPHLGFGLYNNLMLSWENPSGTTNVEIYFGTTIGNMGLLYSGDVINNYFISFAGHNVIYCWQVNTIDSSGNTIGNIWYFKTRSIPHFFRTEDFEYNLFPPIGWSIKTITGSTNEFWKRNTSTSGFGIGIAAVYADFFRASVGRIQALESYCFEIPNYGVLVFDYAYATYVTNVIDQLRIDVSSDSGDVWHQLVLLNGGPSGELTTAPPQTLNFVPFSNQWATKYIQLPSGINKIRFVAISAFGNNLWLDNIYISYTIPVELTSFTANVSDDNIILNWTTASETNNMGFEIQRASSSTSPVQGEWDVVGFVEGNGTTTEFNNYSFTDNNLLELNGKYSYRLKQIDFDGKFDYSNIVEVEIGVPQEFSLSQNYPNPFNPNTVIEYEIPITTFVSLKVYDIMGNEIATLVNETQESGKYSVNFSANNFTSGVYFYQLRAGDFIPTKKMILMK